MMTLESVRSFLNQDISQIIRLRLHQSTDKKNIPSVSIKPEELEQFASICGHGLCAEDAVSVCFKNADQILKALEQGVPFEDILNSGSRSTLLGLLMEQLNLLQALSVRKTLMKTSSRLRETLLSKSLYPLFLLIFSTCLVFFFSKAVLPMMQEYADEQSTMLLTGMQVFFVMIWTVAASLVFCFAAGWISLKKADANSRIPWIFRFSLFRTITTLQFSALLQGLDQCGRSTAEVIELMSRLPGFPFARLLACRLKTGLQKGASLLFLLENDKALDPVLIKIILAGMRSGNLSDMADSALALGFSRLERSLKRFAASMQALSYGSVGMLAISLYQIMLAPLNILQTF